jgi:hypothetical protein
MSDATYKILVEGWPILTVGTTDKCKCFHPFGYAIVSTETWEDFKFYFDAIKKGAKEAGIIDDYNPKKLVADNAPAIHNGFIAGEIINLFIYPN